MKAKQFPVWARCFENFGYGSIEAPVENPQEEIAKAEGWLKSCGAKKVYAPMGLSTWYSYRATMPNSKEPFFYGESNFDAQVWMDAGYKVAAHYTSSLADNDDFIFSVQKKKERLETKGWRIEIYNPQTEGLLERCHEIASKAFVNACCFQPISWEDFRALYRPLLQKIDPRLVLLARSPKGEVAGFCLAYPDMNNLPLKRFVLKTLAVDPMFAMQGIGSWLSGEMHLQAQTLGFTGGGIHAYMWSDSYSRTISKHSANIIREYVLFEKDL